MKPDIEKKRKLRPIFVRLHRYVGLSIALFLIVSGLSGSVIAFDHELDSWLNPDLFNVAEQSTPILSLDELAAHVRNGYPEAVISTIAIKRDISESIRVDVKTEANAVLEVYVNPFTGQILGSRERGLFSLDRKYFVPMMFRLHSNLYLPDRWGFWLLGSIALIWMVDCFVGLYLTLPPAIKSSRPLASDDYPHKSWIMRWQPSWGIKRNASRHRFNFDLHRASGLWFFPIFFILAMSGVSFNLNAEIFRPIVSFFGDMTPDPRKALPKVNSVSNPGLDFSQAVTYASDLLPAPAKTMEVSFVMYMPALHVYRVAFEEKGHRVKPFAVKAEQIFIDADTGILKGRRGYESGTRADRFLALQFPMHSGQVLGLPGRVLISIVGIVTVILSVTGLVLWVRKSQPQKIRNNLSHSIYPRIKRFSAPEDELQHSSNQQAEIRRLKAELRRVNDERDIQNRTE